jgi:starch synthase (maltosyl-transferring)
MPAPAAEAFHIEDIFPSIDCGRFPVKRIAGESVEVWANIYRDGHDVISADLIWRRETEADWQRTPMIHHGKSMLGWCLCAGRDWPLPLRDRSLTDELQRGNAALKKLKANGDQSRRA